MAEDITVQDIVGKLAERLDKLATLEVTTVCSDVSVSVAGAEGEVLDKLRVTIETDDARVAQSGINVVTGDVKALLPKDFFHEDHAEFRAYHDAQVQLSREVMESNLALVGEVLAKVLVAVRDR